MKCILFYLFGLLLISNPALSIQFSKFEEKNRLLIDINDDELVDIVTSQEKGSLVIYFKNNNEVNKIKLLRNESLTSKQFLPKKKIGGIQIEKKK